MVELEWKDPPPPRKAYATQIAELLKTKPGEWALIHKTEITEFLPWWGDLNTHPDFEVKIVYTGPLGGHPIFRTGPREIYARYIGEKKADV